MAEPRPLETSTTRSFLLVVCGLCAGILLLFGYTASLYILSSRASSASTPPVAYRLPNKTTARVSTETIVPPVTSTALIRPNVAVPILMYHQIRQATSTDQHDEKVMSVSPKLFREEMQYLKDNGYTSLTLSDLAAYATGTYALPAKPVIITLDDGWESQYTEAWPVLKQLGLKATFFLIVNEMGKRNVLTWQQAKAMAESGMTIGSHTLTHPYLNRLHDANRQQAEIFDSKQTIEKDLGIPVTVFAYPYGGYNQTVIKLVKQAGYVSARGATMGMAHANDNLYTLKAITVSGDMERFKYKLTSNK